MMQSNYILIDLIFLLMLLIFKGIQMMKDSSKTFDDNYPEMIHKAYIVYGK